MKGFVYAAGFGERLRPLTDTVPKPLVPVAGIPSICYAIGLLREAGITELVCNLHYRHLEIMEFFRERKNFGLAVAYSVEEEILGTGGGLKRCEKLLGDDDFVVMNSDVVTDLDLGPVIDRYISAGSQGILCLARAGGGRGSPKVALKDGRVADIKNLLGTGLAMEYDYMGIAVLSPLIFKYLDETFSTVVDDGFIRLMRDFPLDSHVHEGVWLDMGTRESLEKAERFLQKQGKGLVRRIREATGWTSARA